MEQRSGYQMKNQGPIPVPNANGKISLERVQDVANAVDVVNAVRRAQQMVDSLSPEQKRQAAFGAMSGKTSPLGTMVAAIIVGDDPKLFEDIRHAYSDQQVNVEFPADKRKVYANEQTAMLLRYKQEAVGEFDQALKSTGLAPVKNEPQLQRGPAKPQIQTNASSAPDKTDINARVPVQAKKPEPKSGLTPPLTGAQSAKPFSYTQPTGYTQPNGSVVPSKIGPPPIPVRPPAQLPQQSIGGNSLSNAAKSGDPVMNAPQSRIPELNGPKAGNPLMHASKLDNSGTTAPKHIDPKKDPRLVALAEQSNQFAREMKSASPASSLSLGDKKHQGVTKK